MGLVVAALYILFSCGICLPTALSASRVGIIQPLESLHRHTAGDFSPKPKYLPWRGVSPNGHLLEGLVFMTIYCCGIKQLPDSEE